jgi:hypothetical protein
MMRTGNPSTKSSRADRDDVFHPAGLAQSRRWRGQLILWHTWRGVYLV